MLVFESKQKNAFFNLIIIHGLGIMRYVLPQYSVELVGQVLLGYNLTTLVCEALYLLSKKRSIETHIWW